MKKIMIAALLTIAFSCNNNAENNDNINDTTAADTTIKPDGVVEGSPISTDTAAFNVTDTTKNSSDYPR